MARTSTRKSKEELMAERRREVRNCIIAFVLMMLLIISIFQMGNAGSFIDGFLKNMFGSIPYYLIILQVLAYCIYILFNHGKTLHLLSRYILGPITFNIGLLILFGAIDSHYVTNVYTSFPSMDPAIINESPLGYMQVILFGLFYSLFGNIGAILIAITLILVGIVVFYRISVSDVLITSTSAIGEQGVKLKETIADKVDEYKENKANHVEKTSAFKNFFNRHKNEQLELTSPHHLSSVEGDYFFDDDDFEQEQAIAYQPDPEVTSNAYMPVQELKPVKRSRETLPFDIDDLDFITKNHPLSSEDEDFQEEEIKIKKKLKSDVRAYKLPSFDLLNNPFTSDAYKVNEKYVKEKAQLLTEFLGTFNIAAKVVNTIIGPSVTKFEIALESGVSVNVVKNKGDDIKLALAVKQVRIEAPIPGKSYVGIEIPNFKNNMVTLKEVLNDIDYANENKLVFGIGKDINNQSIYTTLDKMPHLLIAGSTGSGKSVMINAIIVSILMNASYQDVKLVLVDPKKVELSVYNDIPHLLTNVINDPKAASIALKRIVSEMEYRYGLMDQSGTKKIDDHNKYVDAFNKRCRNEEDMMDRMPYIVIVIDELADLMLVARNEVEESINRITALARAAGIFLIVATQRPSTDVITGVIKNNIPSRIAFAVASQVDSRTIIGHAGAETLLGKGDMLFAPQGLLGSPERIQGAYLSDEEILRVVNAIKAQDIPIETNELFTTMEESPTLLNDGNSEDEIYPDVLDYVLTQEEISTSKLQRVFSIGFNRASNLMDDLERNGIVGQSRGSKARLVINNNAEE